MELIEETRRLNLLRIIDAHGGRKGGQRKLSEACGGTPSPAQISQWVNRSPDARTGKPRAIRGDSARSMERKLGLPTGWMDQQASTDEAADQAVAPPETHASYLAFSQMDLPIGAGRGKEVESEPEVVRSLQISRKWAESKFSRAMLQHIQIFPVDGESMVAAGILPGDILFVDTRINHFDSGDGYYIVQFRQGWQVKKLRANIITQCIEIVSMPSTGEEVQPVTPEQESEIRIGGKVAAWWTLRKF